MSDNTQHCGDKHQSYTHRRRVTVLHDVSAGGHDTVEHVLHAVQHLRHDDVDVVRLARRADAAVERRVLGQQREDVVHLV